MSCPPTKKTRATARPFPMATLHDLEAGEELPCESSGKDCYGVNPSMV